MSTTIDARGLSCPQPVLITLDAIKSSSEAEIAVMVDTDTSKENVARAAESQGWQVKEVKPEGKEFCIILTKD